MNIFVLRLITYSKFKGTRLVTQKITSITLDVCLGGVKFENDISSEQLPALIYQDGDNGFEEISTNHNRTDHYQIMVFPISTDEIKFIKDGRIWNMLFDNFTEATRRKLLERYQNDFQSQDELSRQLLDQSH
jgi:hypothetical protein